MEAHEGDGKVFTGPVTLACRIRTGERGEAAVPGGRHQGLRPATHATRVRLTVAHLSGQWKGGGRGDADAHC